MSKKHKNKDTHKHNKEAHAIRIRSKYYFDDMHIYVSHGHNGYYHTGGDWKNRKKIVFVSKEPVNYYSEVRAPHTLDNIISLLKREEAIIKDIEDHQIYTLEEFAYSRLVLRLAGVE